MGHLANRPAAVALLAVAFGLLAACSKPAPAPAPAPSPPAAASGIRVIDITVGRSLNADKTIADATSTFGPTDPFYVAVKTAGSAPSATLEARFTYGDGQAVGASSQTIAPTGPMVTELHATKPDGWPAGEYRVEVLLNGTSAGTRKLEVR